MYYVKLVINVLSSLITSKLYILCFRKALALLVLLNKTSLL